ncbi:MAG: hypothetical protein QM756_08240 [Polyangiaceae bacterium]
MLVRTAALVGRERAATVEVIEYLVEIQRRRLFLEQACSSLFGYCRERLGFSEDEAFKRARVARLALRRPQVLSELRGGAIHLTGLFVLAPYAKAPNFATLLNESRGKSRAQIEQMLATHFPREAGPARIREQRSRIEPLSATTFRVEFTASAELRGKLERAQELLSHLSGAATWRSCSSGRWIVCSKGRRGVAWAPNGRVHGHVGGSSLGRVTWRLMCCARYGSAIGVSARSKTAKGVAAANGDF